MGEKNESQTRKYAEWFRDENETLAHFPFGLFGFKMSAHANTIFWCDAFMYECGGVN